MTTPSNAPSTESSVLLSGLDTPRSTTPIASPVLRCPTTAADQVYHIPELRAIILEYASLRSLTRIRCTDKLGFDEASKLVYRSIPDWVATTLGKSKSSRRVEYAACVKLIDTSPLPHFKGGQKDYLLEQKHGPYRAPVIFNRARLQRKASRWRNKFPNLHAIHYLYPTIQTDEAYIAHLDPTGAIVSIELRTLIELEINCHFYAAQAPPVLPIQRVIDGVEVLHTIMLRLVDGDHGNQRWKLDQTERNHHLAQWKAWLYDNADIDHRISAIDSHSIHRYSITLNTIDITGYLSHRTLAGCQPLSHFSLQGVDNSISTVVHNLANVFGTGIRVLRIDSTVISALGNIQTAVCLIGSAFPKLDELSIAFGKQDGQPLPDRYAPRGLANVRRISLTGYEKEGKGHMAEYVCGLGSGSCVFQDPGKRYTKLSDNFDLEVKHARLRQMRGARDV